MAISILNMKEATNLDTSVITIILSGVKSRGVERSYHIDRGSLQ